jgi:TonB family protein
MRPRSSFALLITLCLPGSGSSQTSVAIGGTAADDGRISEWMSGEHIPAVRGLPFSAKVELEMFNQLPDGTLITHKTYNLDARDSLGRTRNEARKWIDPAIGAEPVLIRIELYDPATRMRTSLFPLTKIGRQWNVRGVNTSATGSTQSAAGKGEASKEDLGTDTIEGLPVRGLRVTQTYPVGALGNDRPLAIVTESWYSDQLKINLLTKRTDPRYGVETVRVTELRRDEPDAAFFGIPSEYKIVNVTPVLQANHQTALEDGVTADSAGSSQPMAGVARAGVNGTTIPACLYCPTPSYTDEARAAKLSGNIVLQVVVSAAGRTETIHVLRGLGYGLDQSAVETVRTWRFRPAVAADGEPVAVTVPIQVAFRLR